jgi:small GTP-binding protein
MEETPEYRFKLVILGEWGVGKTSLVRNYVEQKFAEDYLPTLGVNVLVKEIDVEHNGEVVKVSLSIWDLAGQKEFRAMAPAYHAGASGAFFVGDLSRIMSFDELPTWYEDLVRNVKKPIPTILLANKCDLHHYVEDSYLDEVAAQVGALKWFKTSAVTGESVQESFQMIAEKMLEEYLGQ